MGVMTSLAPADHTPLVFTPHPVTLEGQQFLPVELREGETLGQFLDRTIDLGADAWEVKIGGVVVPVEHWDRVKPKHGHLIEVRGAVRKQALYIVAMIALTYFTFGIGTAAGWGAGAAAGAFGGGLAGAVFAGAVFAAGSILINKALGPKPPKQSSEDRESVYNLAGARNAVRPHEPLGLLFGSTRIAPDVISQPYTRYYGNDQYLHFVLTPGLNVDRFDDLYLGDTLLSSYEGVQVWTSGFPGMPEQPIPLYTNADTVAGGELDSSTWVERTTSPDTVEILINLEYLLGGVGTSGKKYYVDETVQVQYRPVGSSTWLSLATQNYRSNVLEQRRATIARTVPKGQYDVRVRILGLGDYTGANTQLNDFTWSTLVSVQEDTTDYRGIPRIGVKIKATGQLNGTPDQIRAVFHQKAMPVWNGTSWGTATDRASGLSNPGALILAYARGYKDPDDNLVAGMGLPDSMIDIPALQAFMLHCAAKGYSYDHWLQSPRSHAEVVESIALAGFGQTTWAGGKLSVVWAADGQPLSGVVNMATMKRGTFEVDYNLASAADGIEYTYFNRDTWQTATLRVPAPGVTTMLNPARLTGEGVTTEAHAAKLARYHLAQHLYQFKSIGFSTDLEHMSYRRLSCLALQHDMTKWGRGGRVVSAVNTGGTVTLTLDEPVAPPTSGNAYIGLRIPGERVYRVLQVASFATETDTITLAEAWPADAPLPGSSAANPAHDTIWIYDFKATPGYRVRVVSIEPESGLKGARIGVVPESPEFWTYVETGHYEPPVAPPVSTSRPVASNLVISETQEYVGAGEYTELTATFDISGHAAYSVVLAGLVDQPLREVAQTTTRTATWRIPEAGEYAIVVRPFDSEGMAGGAVSTTYITSKADTPPTLFDWFEVQELDGGVRNYRWGYNSGTMQPANLAGAEIRYIAGDVADPDWDAMTPVVSGYQPSSFESSIPEAGTWTFVIRARNTSGILSTTGLRIVRVLQANIGEVIDDVSAKALEANLKAAGALLLMGDEYDPDSTYIPGDVVYFNGRMYRAHANVPLAAPPPNATYWDDVGTVTEAQGATLTAQQQLRTDIDEQGNEIAALTQQVGDAETNVTQLMEVVVSGNAIDQPAGAGFEGDVAADWNGGNPLPFQVQHITYEKRTGDYALRIGWGRGSNVALGNSRSLRVKAGERIKFGFWARTSGSIPTPGATVYLGLYWTDAVGAGIDYTGAAALTSTGQAFGYTEFSEWVTVPAGATHVRIDILANDWADGWFAIDDVFAARPSALEETAMARHTVALDVNGHVSGTVSENDGTRSSFSILATVFRVISTLTGMGMEWQDGYLRIWRGAAQLLIGHAFGSGDLVFWYGPNVGASACAKGNGKIWFDTSGDAYFGGTLSAGILKNAAQSTQVSTTAQVSTGRFNTNGNPKVVVFSLSYQQAGRLPTNEGASALSATVVLERSRDGSGVWTQVSSMNVTGSRSFIDFEPGLGYLHRWELGGSSTFTDSATGTEDFEYRARITASSGDWPRNVGGTLGTQRLAIISTEEP